jgi:hypothetical protein
MIFKIGIDFKIDGVFKIINDIMVKRIFANLIMVIKYILIFLLITVI